MISTMEEVSYLVQECSKYAGTSIDNNLAMYALWLAQTGKGRMENKWVNRIINGIMFLIKELESKAPIDEKLIIELHKKIFKSFPQGRLEKLFDKFRRNNYVAGKLNKNIDRSKFDAFIKKYSNVDRRRNKDDISIELFQEFIDAKVFSSYSVVIAILLQWYIRELLEVEFKILPYSKFKSLELERLQNKGEGLSTLEARKTATTYLRGSIN